MTIIVVMLSSYSIGLQSSAFGGKKFDVIVNLSNTSDNIGKYLIHVTVYGKETLEQSRVIDTSSQICRDDTDSLCHVNVGTFSFPSRLVPVDSRVQACVEEISSGTQNCVDGKNTEMNTPERITVGVPSLN